MKDVAIVVINYKELLNPLETISLNRCLDVFKNRDIFFVYPNNMSLLCYETALLNHNRMANFLAVDSKWFQSVSTYCKLLIQKDFYTYFSEYKYILIYQLDCYVFKDNLDYFIDMGYNYYGAAWNYSNLYKTVGNGGLSLRNVAAFIENIEERKDLDFINRDDCEFMEDVAFCNGFYPIKNICPFEIAEEFSFETTACWRVPENMEKEDFPMGLHGFSKDEFIDIMGRMIKRWDMLNEK